MHSIYSNNKIIIHIYVFYELRRRCFKFFIFATFSIVRASLLLLYLNPAAPAPSCFTHFLGRNFEQINFISLQRQSDFLLHGWLTAH